MDVTAAKTKIGDVLGRPSLAVLGMIGTGLRVILVLGCVLQVLFVFSYWLLLWVFLRLLL